MVYICNTVTLNLAFVNIPFASTTEEGFHIFISSLSHKETLIYT